MCLSKGTLSNRVSGRSIDFKIREYCKNKYNY
nr:MAG TPA: hypothetical protein [Caudoviricetes sp.]